MMTVLNRLGLKKNQNASRHSEHPPVMGEKCQNVLLVTIGTLVRVII